MVNYFILLMFAGLVLGLSSKKGITRIPKKNAYGKISRTLKGHNVRSNGEKQIADWLYSHNIRYKYEPKLSKFVPDFFLPDYRMVIEFYGMRDAPGKIGEKYRKKILRKRGYFSSLSVKLVELYQEDLSRLDHIIPERLHKDR